MPEKGQHKSELVPNSREKEGRYEDFVLEKNIFSNIFEKDIRRVFIYKKAERLAKAIHLITPAFAYSPSLRNRMDAIAVGLIDAAILAPHSARVALSRELLALSSVLSIGRTGGFLSPMNADLIAKEAQTLLQEVASYEEPHLLLEQAPSLAELARKAGREQAPALAAPRAAASPKKERAVPAEAKHPQAHKADKGHIKDTNRLSRREQVIAVIKDKGQSSIKDISTLIRSVSEKTIQRELQSLIDEGVIKRSGERRWSTYSLI